MFGLLKQLQCDDLIFGDRWCKMFLQCLTNSTDGNAVSPDHPSSSISFCQRVSEQRHDYSLKHCLSDTVLCQKRKLATLMTHAREAKLKSIGFLFSCPYDCGIDHHRWMQNFRYDLAAILFHVPFLSCVWLVETASIKK